MAKANPIQMQKYLSGVDYPCDRDKLVAHARSQARTTRYCRAWSQCRTELSTARTP